MKMHKIFIMCVMLAFVLVAISPIIAGENDSLHIVLSVEDKDYRAEDTVILTLHVYDNGQLADVPGHGDNITIDVREHYGLGHEREDLVVTHDSTGVYTASFTITDQGHLYFECEVTSGADTEEIDTLYIHVTETEFSVDVNFHGQDIIIAHPGDIVTATIEIRYGSTLVNVDGFDTLEVTGPDSYEQNLTEMPISTGIYEATYTVPMTMSSGEYELEARPSGVGGHNDEASILVNVLDVWYHKLTAVGETVTFEVCVADIAGLPISGASLAITRGGWPYDTLTGTTNDTGRVLMSMTNVAGDLGITGYVLSGGYNQSIEGFIINPQPETPHHSGLDIIWTGSEYTFTPSSSVSIPYTAYYDALPLNAQSIHYYVTAWGSDYGFMGGLEQGHVDASYDVVAAGTVTTGATGTFTVAFSTPPSQCLLRVFLEVPLDSTEFDGEIFDQNDGFYYETWPDNEWTDGSDFYVVQGNLDNDPGVKIDAKGFKLGEANTVTVTMPADHDDVTMAGWAVGEWDMDIENYNPTWMSWVPGGYLIALSENADGELEGTYTVPTFIDDDSVTIMAGYMDGNTGFPHYNSKIVGKHKGGIPSVSLFAVVISVVVIAMIFRVTRPKTP